MKVIGIRVEPKKVRYALVETDGTHFSLLNSECESRLVFPVDVVEADEKVDSLHRELERVFHENPNILKCYIETNEYTRTDSKSKRETAHFERAILLMCRQKNVPVTSKIYASHNTRSAEVMGHTEQRVGRTQKYWDAKIADTVVAASNGARN